MKQRLHTVSASAYHWANEVSCPTCKTGKGFRCIDMDSRATSLPNNTVHVARVQANGHVVKA